jgi:hypothetical protein
LRDSTNMTVDPFSDILKLANAQSVVSGGFTAGGSWAIRFPAFDKLKFSAMIPFSKKYGTVSRMSDGRSRRAGI